VSRRRTRAAPRMERRFPAPDEPHVSAQVQRPPPAPAPAPVQEAATSQARKPFSRRALVAHLAIRSAAASTTALALLGGGAPNEAVTVAAPAEATAQASTVVNDGL
jgi:hypothetical protein